MKLSADERTRMLYEKREMARMDFESMKDGAVKSARMDIARNAVDMGMDTDTIIKLTGLARKEIKALNQED